MPSKTNPLLRGARELSKKKSNDEDDDQDDKATSKAPGWLTKGKDKIDSEKKANQGGGNRPMDFFLLNKEKAQIRLLLPLDKLEQSVGRHQYPAKSKTGKRYFKAFTCTRDPKTCAGCANGDRPSMRLPLIVIDMREIEYKNKDGKGTETRSNVPKLWLPSINELDNLTTAIEEAREDQGDENIDTHNSVIRVSRQGEGPKTSYRFSVVKTGVKLSSEMKEAVAAFEEEYGTLMEILKPLPLAEQRVIAGIRASDDEDDEDDLDDEEDEAEDIEDDEDDEDDE